MDIDKLTKLMEVFLSWPVVILVVFIYLGASIKNFIKNMHEFRFKLPSGIEGTAITREQLQSAALLGAALATGSDGTSTEGLDSQINQVSEGEVRGIANVVSQHITPQTVRQVSGSSVLWVDDHPSNNYYKRKALELLGIHFTISTSTADALEKVSRRKYDVIISDMRHPFDQLVASSPPDEWAISSPPDEQTAFDPMDEYGAYTLLEELRQRHINTPFIIHSSSSSEKKAEARRRGAFGFTGNAETLFRLVIDAILSTQSS